jgi:hypothetical protein
MHVSIMYTCPGTDAMIFEIFSPKKLAKKLAFLTQNKAKLWKKFEHNIGFWEKRHFVRRKLSKIAENCDHNIGPLRAILRRRTTGPSRAQGRRPRGYCPRRRSPIPRERPRRCRRKKWFRACSPRYVCMYVCMYIWPGSDVSFPSVELGARVTRWVCEKFAQSVAQQIFCQIWWCKKSSPKFGATYFWNKK